MAWLGGIPPRITPSAHRATGSGDLQPLPPLASRPPAVGANIILVIPIEPATGGQIDQVRFIGTGITAIERETTLANQAHPFAERTGHLLKKQGIIVGHTNSFPENPGVEGSRRRASPSAWKKNRSGHVPERQKARVTRATDRSELRGGEPVAANQPDITQEAVQQFLGMQNDESLDRPGALVEYNKSRPEVDWLAVEVLRAFAVFA